MIGATTNASNPMTTATSLRLVSNGVASGWRRKKCIDSSAKTNGAMTA